jgi:hypothetical protein
MGELLIFCIGLVQYNNLLRDIRCRNHHGWTACIQLSMGVACTICLFLVQLSNWSLDSTVLVRRCSCLQNDSHKSTPAHSSVVVCTGVEQTKEAMIVPSTLRKRLWRRRPQATELYSRTQALISLAFGASIVNFGAVCVR